MRVRLAVVALLAAALVPAAAQAGVSRHTIESGGRERAYRVYTPPGLDRTRPVPVVLVFHGFAQSVRKLVRLTGFDDEAREGRFLAVYPESVGLGWNAEDCCGAGPILGVDDLGFVDDLLADLRQRYTVDARRTYATGISNGGIFAYYLACHRAGTFAAVGPVSATMFRPCNPSRRVSVIHVHGLDDRVIPYEGGNGLEPLFDWPSVPGTIAFWRRWDDCGAARSRRQGAAHVTTSSCANGTGIKLIAVEGQGHGWPDEPIDTTDAVWAFFKAHPRRS
jgi:polyhydroxybutyrate depolymerase